jgi:sugar/nucleoside kinase (ribokinase family)
MKKILVLGGAHIDRRGLITGETSPAASNPGRWMEEAGGGGFNAARNLSRLGFDVRIISPRGGDATGEAVAAAAIEADVQDTPFVFLDRKTPSYTAILERDGNLIIALADMDLYDLFSPRRLRVRAVRDAIAATDAILCDANLPKDTLSALGKAAKEQGKLLAAIAISPAKVVKLQDALENIDILFMNEAEARTITGHSPEKSADWPALLREAGVRGGVVTRGSNEVIAFVGENTASLQPPVLKEVRDVTGAGDALASGFLAGHLQGENIGESLRWGTAAAAITVLSPFATSHEMSQKLEIPDDKANLPSPSDCLFRRSCCCQTARRTNRCP